MSERLEEPRTEEVLGDLPADSAAEEIAPADAPVQPGNSPSWLRLAYSFEFLLALLTIFTVWSEVGGQGHLDLMPWYTKLVCSTATAWCIVRLTAGMVEEQKTWNRRTILWLTGLVLVGVAMAAITYYYHLHEEPGDQDSDETSVTAMVGKHAGFPVSSGA